MIFLTNVLYIHDIFPKERDEYTYFKKKEQSALLELSNPNIITTGFTSNTHFDYIEKSISSCENNVKLATFIFDDLDMADLLLETAKRLNGGVYVLTSIIDDKLRREQGYSKSDINRHLEVLRKLENSPVIVRCVNGLHAKFWIFDSKEVVITSANLTKNSLKYVPELGFPIRTKKSVDKLIFEFNNMWLNVASKKIENGKLISLNNTNNFHLEDPGRDKKLKIYKKLRLNNSDEFDYSWFNHYHKLIEFANEEILISSYSLDFSGEIIDELIEQKLNSGIIVKILISEANYKRNATLRQWLNDKLKSFSDIFSYFIHPKNHTKFVIVDKSKVFISTKNYEREDKYDYSFEIGFRRDNIAPDLLKIWEKLCKDSHELLIAANRREYIQKLSDTMNISFFSNDYEIKIWHPQAPVFGYLYGPTLKEICKEISKAKYVKVYINGNNQILSINRNLRLVLRNGKELIRIDEKGDILTGSTERLLDFNKMTFIREAVLD